MTPEGCLGIPQVGEEEMGIPGRWTVRTKAKKGEHRGHGVERRHAWQDWSKEFMMKWQKMRSGWGSRALCALLRGSEGDSEPLKVFKEGQDMLLFLF